MVGLNPEFAHETMSGLSFHHAVAQCLWQGKLFHIDLNAQRIGKFDQDFRFGSEGIRDAFYLVKLLEDAGWDGHAPLRRPRLPHRGRGRRVGLRPGCMRTYLILRDKAPASPPTPRSRRRCGWPRPTGWPSRRSRTALARGHRRAAGRGGGRRRRRPGRQGYGHERLDQLVTELLLGAR